MSTPTCPCVGPLGIAQVHASSTSRFVSAARRRLLSSSAFTGNVVLDRWFLRHASAV